MKKIVLASASPRRKELLENAGIKIEILVSNIDERAKPGETPEQYAARNAVEKAAAVQKSVPQMAKGAVVIGCDTIVVTLSGDILEKPTDEGHAKKMLRQLSGATHHVFSGFALVDGDTGATLHSQLVKTAVTFRILSDDEIENYVKSKEPMDKAGSYGAQALGAAFIQRIDGSYSNVVGLPLCEVCEALKRHAGLSLFA